MRITIGVDGGFAVFPGLSRPISFDIDDLPPEQAAALRSAIDHCDLFARDDSSVPTPTGAADVRQFVVTIVDGIRRCSLAIPETVEQPDLKRLLVLLDDQRRALRSG